MANNTIQAVSNHGAILEIQINGTFMPILGIESFDFDPGTREIIRAATHESPVEHSVTGIRKNAQITGTIVWDEMDQTQNAFLKAYEGDQTSAANTVARQSFKLTFQQSQGNSFTFSGYVAQFKPSGDVDAIKSADFTIAIDGAVNYGPSK